MPYKPLLYWYISLYTKGNPICINIGDVLSSTLKWWHHGNSKIRLCSDPFILEEIKQQQKTYTEVYLEGCVLQVWDIKR